MAVEEQTQYDSSIGMFSAQVIRDGQRLTIPNRLVTNLGFWLHKSGSPSGDVTFTIRKVSDDSIINSKVWGAATGLEAGPTYEEVEFDTPVTINQEVRIACEFSGGNADNRVFLNLQNADVKANECRSYHYEGEWSDVGNNDDAYRYTYEEEKPAAGGGPASLIAAGII